MSTTNRTMNMMWHVAVSLSANKQGSLFFNPVKTFPCFPKIFPWFFLSFHQDILVKKNTFILFKCGLSDISLCKYYLIKCNSLKLLKKGFTVLKNIFPRLKGLKMVLKKRFPDLKIFSLILAENSPFSLTGKTLQKFADFPDRWEPWNKPLHGEYLRYIYWISYCLPCILRCLISFDIPPASVSTSSQTL